MMFQLKQQNHTETLMKHTILSSVDATKQRVGLSMNAPAGQVSFDEVTKMQKSIGPQNFSQIKKSSDKIINLPKMQGISHKFRDNETLADKLTDKKQNFLVNKKERLNGKREILSQMQKRGDTTFVGEDLSQKSMERSIKE